MTLKSLTFIICSSIFIINDDTSLKASFEQSKEQELQSMYAHAKEHNPEWTDEQIKNFFLTFSCAATHKDQIKSLQSLKQLSLQTSENNPLTEQIQDILETFDILKKTDEYSNRNRNFVLVKY